VSEVRLFIGGALFQGKDPLPQVFIGIIGGVFPRVPADHCRFPLFSKVLLLGEIITD
jgi:hypothetical protein